MANSHFAVVILAAGKSQRMGRPKLLLPWSGSSVIGCLLERWTSMGIGQIGVVHGPEPMELQAELDAHHFPRDHRILNPNPDAGMFSSVRCAARWSGWNPKITHWIITLGDQPHLRKDTLAGLLQFGAAHPNSVCQPVFDRRRCHPVLLPERIFRKVAVSPAATLKLFLADYETDWTGYESEDSGLRIDMDTPEDYERLRQTHSDPN